MISASLQTFAQKTIEHGINSLPEGLLIVLFAWTLLRLLPRQNSRTRFAVWFAALLVVAALPLFGGLFHRTTTALFPPVTTAISLPAAWATIFFVIWTLAVSVMTARLAVGLWRLRELRQSCNVVHPEDLAPPTRELFAELNATDSFVSRPVTIATSERVRVPAAIGLWTPMIVLPPWALRELPPSELGIVLRHEFAHLRHWDDWTNLIQKFLRALFFFHPAVWWIENRLSVEREMACDDVVVAQTANPAGYASCLVSLLERSLAGRGWAMTQAIVHRARETSMRLARILDPKRTVATRISKPALGLVGAFAGLCLAMLPNTPQVISFEQGGPEQVSSSAAAREFSTVVAPSPVGPSSLIHRASFPTSPRPAVVTSASFKPESRPLSPRKIRRAIPANADAVGAAQAANAREALMESQLAGDALMAAAHNPSFLSDKFETARHEPNFQQQDIEPTFSTVVFVQETQFVESDSSVVWRIQVWHVMLVDSAWEHKARVPAAHST
jgi:beta-lactamase regulating signal transducer with metallopeptidase domain